MKYIALCDDMQFEDTAQMARAEGLGIEVQSFFLPQALDDYIAAVDRHCKALWGLEHRSLHGPFAELSPGSIDPLIRSVTRRRILQAVEVARLLNIEQIVLHHGYWPGTAHPSKWIARIEKFFKDLLRLAPDSMVFHLENFQEDDPQFLADVIDSIGSDRVDLCLDIGHAHAFTDIPLPKWIKTLGSRIGYVHLHDNKGNKDEHKGLGEGTIKIGDTLAALEEYAPDAVWGIESKDEGLMKSLAYLGKNGFLAV